LFQSIVSIDCVGGQLPMRGLGLIALAGGILAALPALAANVSIVPADGTLRGNVFVNRGRGFEPIVATIEGRPGDSVMASKGGVAKIVYPDGCTVEASSTTAVVFVQETSPCKVPAATQTTGGLSAGKYAIGAAIVGGAVAAAVLVGGSNNNGGSQSHGNSGGSGNASP
jgi:hypothetical protein